MMLRINDDVAIPDNEIRISAIRARGPGGQHVNKVSTAIQLRFDINASSTLPEAVREKLLATRDHRITAAGVIIIKAQKSRSQEQNRLEALEKLSQLLRSGFVQDKLRKKTRPPARAKEKRLADKSHKSRIKQSRHKVLSE